MEITLLRFLKPNPTTTTANVIAALKWPQFFFILWSLMISYAMLKIIIIAAVNAVIFVYKFISITISVISKGMRSK